MTLGEFRAATHHLSDDLPLLGEDSEFGEGEGFLYQADDGRLIVSTLYGDGIRTQLWPPQVVAIRRPRRTIALDPEGERLTLTEMVTCPECGKRRAGRKTRLTDLCRDCSIEAKKEQMWAWREKGIAA